MPAGDTTYSNGDNYCAVPSTRRASSSSWLVRGNYSDTDAAVHTRRTRHSFAFACTAWCKNWFEGSHSHIRRPRCHVALSCFPKGYPIYQKCGTQNSIRFVEISKLAWSLGDSVCDSLIGLHAFTGCDTVSAFASRRKRSALKPMKSDITYIDTFIQVGQSWDAQPQLSEKVQQFTCRM